ncbi:MerR family transcriptional regulator [Phytomonospora sp. NPDC050363]|uniref:MerR family transcriptional regulator n=1 Tax=Phytomonospora sp. NPDC050363 TaxID=3155642 RepID=UPI0033E9BB75
MSDGLSPGEVARRLGIAVTTLRTWHQRYGLGPSRHSTGQHRRYGDDDLARLETMRRLTTLGLPAAAAARVALAPGSTPEPTARAGGGHAIRMRSASRAARGLAAAAMRLDVLAMRELIAGHLVDHGVVRTWDDLVRPVLSGIGTRHAGTGRFVEVEHLLSRSVSEALAAVPRPGAGSPVRVMLACADGEMHSLPLEALAAALAEQGVGSRLLGARVPPVALLDAVARTGPILVVVWSHEPATADPEPLTALVEAAPVVAVAGTGWSPPLPEQVITLPTLREAVDLAMRLAAA